MQHGGGSVRIGRTAALKLAQGSQPDLDPSLYPGFSYLFGAPAPEQRCSLGADVAQAREVLSALVNLLPKPGNTKDCGVNDDATNTSDVPSGYTYFLQFVAHDLVQTTIPFWAAAETGAISRNMRGAGLQLDALYGGGPTASPHAFEPYGSNAPPAPGMGQADPALTSTTDDRTLLRIGRISPGTPTSAKPEGACPFRDIPRVNVPFALEPSGRLNNRVNFDNAFLVCIADARNADTVILSQLVVLFSIVHNAIVGQMTDLPPQAAFSYARVAVLYMYYAIIGHDLLPRVLHDTIFQQIVSRHARDQRWLWQGNDIPLEFSHGAFRFGHAMIRQQYVLNSNPGDGGTFGICATISGQPSPRSIAIEGHNEFLKPLSPEWIVEWSRFFYFDKKDYPTASTPNFARRLTPHASSMDPCHLFDHSDNKAIPDGVTLRDALSAATARMWTIDALVAEVRIRCPDLIPACWLFGSRYPEKDNEIRHQQIRQWLEGLTGDGDMTPQKQTVRDNIDVLCRDLPLSLFVLLEAGAEYDAGRTKGGQLGVLGSIIVGEVIGRRLAQGRAMLEPFVEPAKAALKDLWCDIRAVTDMPALITFAEKHAGLSNCEGLPFVAKPQTP